MITARTSKGLHLRCLDPQLDSLLLLNKKKILIGSADCCDVLISGHEISSYHALLYLKNEGFMIKDLYSEGGVFVNGSKVDESFVSFGDVLRLGELSFSVEFSEESEVMLDLDHSLPLRPGLVLVDGDYCDIEFDESAARPILEVPEVCFSGEYIELDEVEEGLDLSFSVENKTLEIMNYMNGLVMDVSYVKLQEGDYYLNSKKTSRNDFIFHTIDRTKILSFHQGFLRFYPHDLISSSIPWDQIDLQKPLFLTLGAEQISMRLVEHSTSWKSLPFFYRDKLFYKDASKVFVGVFLPLLLLLFVSFQKEERPMQDIAIVYKISPKVAVSTPVEALEKSEVKTQEVTSETQNSGHKESDQQSSRVEFSEASAKKKSIAKAQASSPAAQSAAPEAVKAYEFKTSVAVNSIVGEGPKINTAGSGSKSAVSDSDFKSSGTDMGELTKASDIGVSKFNGSDKKGSGEASYGSRGLASKSGYDSSYLEPKTVVLGSMDPELLRKILREYIPQFRHCYQQELIGQSEKVKGIIDLNFTISASGKVARYDIKVKDAQFSSKGVGCMGQVLGLIDFPKPKGGGVVDVRQPLNFFAETEKI